VQIYSFWAIPFRPASRFIHSNITKPKQIKNSVSAQICGFGKLLSALQAVLYIQISLNPALK
jgi:hypothetical protein